MLIGLIYTVRMDTISQIHAGLRATLPSIDYNDLLAMEDPSAEFEAHCAAETGKDYWFYSVCGKLVNGDVILVRASTPLTAETLAQEGLRDTLAALRRHRDNTGLEATVEMRPA